MPTESDNGNATVLLRKASLLHPHQSNSAESRYEAFTTNGSNIIAAHRSCTLAKIMTTLLSALTHRTTRDAPQRLHIGALDAEQHTAHCFAASAPPLQVSQHKHKAHK
eukprot:7766828-Alexandrium_andersonii.AAC.2